MNGRMSRRWVLPIGCISLVSPGIALRVSGYLSFELCNCSEVAVLVCVKNEMCSSIAACTMSLVCGVLPCSCLSVRMQYVNNLDLSLPRIPRLSMSEWMDERWVLVVFVASVVQVFGLVWSLPFLFSCCALRSFSLGVHPTKGLSVSGFNRHQNPFFIFQRRCAQCV